MLERLADLIRPLLDLARRSRQPGHAAQGRDGRRRLQGDARHDVDPGLLVGRARQCAEGAGLLGRAPQGQARRRRAACVGAGRGPAGVERLGCAPAVVEPQVVAAAEAPQIVAEVAAPVAEEAAASATVATSRAAASRWRQPSPSPKSSPQPSAPCRRGRARCRHAVRRHGATAERRSNGRRSGGPGARDARSRRRPSGTSGRDSARVTPQGARLPRAQEPRADKPDAQPAPQQGNPSSRARRSRASRSTARTATGGRERRRGGPGERQERTRVPLHASPPKPKVGDLRSRLTVRGAELAQGRAGKAQPGMIRP